MTPADPPAPATGRRPAVAVVERRTVRSPDGTALSVIIASPPPEVALAAAPPVLAVHGFASSAAGNWQRTGHLDTLIRAGRVVVALDLRGHGQSDRPHRTEDYALAAVLADVVATATQVGPAAGQVGPAERPAASPEPARPGPIDLLGYSLGARLSWLLASRRMLPIRRMVVGGFDGRPLFQGVDTEDLERLAAGGRNNDRVALRHLVAGLSGTGGVTPGDRLPEIPMLVVAGDRDPLASRASEFAARLPHGTFLSVPGRTHISTVPASAFRQGARDFLGA